MPPPPMHELRRARDQPIRPPRRAAIAAAARRANRAQRRARRAGGGARAAEEYARNSCIPRTRPQRTLEASLLHLKSPSPRLQLSQPKPTSPVVTSLTPSLQLSQPASHTDHCIHVLASSLRGVSAETLPPHPMASDAAGHPWAADGGGRADAAGADGGADDGAGGGAGGGEDGGADADGGARADAAGSPTLPETRAGSAPAEKAAENFRLELGGVTVDFDSSEGEEFVVSSRAHFSLPDETPGGEKNHVEKKNELIMNDSAIVADDGVLLSLTHFLHISHPILPRSRL